MIQPLSHLPAHARLLPQPCFNPSRLAGGIPRAAAMGGCRRPRQMTSTTPKSTWHALVYTMQRQVDHRTDCANFASLTQDLRTCTQQAHTSEFAKDPIWKRAWAGVRAGWSGLTGGCEGPREGVHVRLMGRAPVCFCPMICPPVSANPLCRCLKVACGK